ncbi:MAG: hypothetical protein Q8M02_07470 [Candidatus Didemnitutus sp.]|nr:hypothetical protein [Candidatus Didemnitutus sp.]
MLLQLKRRDAAPAAAPVWHPNFRNFERLPDTKVVRTTFFINVASIALAVLLAGITSWVEYQSHVLVQQTEGAQAAIDKQKKQNAENLRLTKLFADEEKKFAEATAFVRTPITTSAMILELGTTLPPEIQIEYVDLRPHDETNPSCIVRGKAAGTKDQASGAASAYVETLRSHPVFKERFESVNLTALNADPRAGVMVFEIVMQFKTAAKGGKKS